MDDTRLNELRNSDHETRDRNAAYRMVLERANRSLVQRDNRTVILDATYAPAEHRNGVTLLAASRCAEVYVIECRVSPNDAAERFRSRKERHAAIDLNEARVRDIAATWSYYGGGLLINTSITSEGDSLHRVRDYIDSGIPIVSLEAWVQAAPGDATPALVSRDQRELDPPRRISPVSKPQASALVLAAVAAVIIMGFLDGLAVLELYHEASSPERQIAEELFAAVGAFAVSVGFFEYFGHKGFKQAWEVLRAGSTARFGPILEVRRSNREIWAEYTERIGRPEVLRALPMPGVPVCFVVPPRAGVSFDVHCAVDGTGWDQRRLVCDAAAGRPIHFSWHEFVTWRTREMHGTYFGWLRGHKKYLRVSQITELTRAEPQSRALLAQGARISYADYLVTEQSARIEVPGQLPYMREFLEGPPWDKRDLNLTRLDFSDSRYSMMAGVSTIITTTDGCVVLQRRAGHVQAARGGVGCSSGGAVDWSDVKLSRRSRRNTQPSLRRTMFRETREELGLKEDLFESDDAPFVGAAFNLRYGRDLNFYAHLRCRLSREEFSRGFRLNAHQRILQRLRRRTSHFRRAKDRWEISHLLFVHVDQLRIEDDGSFSPHVERLLGTGRHVRGALYAFVKSGRADDVRKLAVRQASADTEPADLDRLLRSTM